MTADLIVQRELQYKLNGRGLTVVVDHSWTRAQVAMRLADLAADLLGDVQGSAGTEGDEGLFVRAEAARSALGFAARSCGDVAEHQQAPPALDPMPLGPPQEPVDVVCPTCNADRGHNCRDQRPGRNLADMRGYHPERVKAFKS